MSHPHGGSGGRRECGGGAKCWTGDEWMAGEVEEEGESTVVMLPKGVCFTKEDAILNPGVAMNWS